MINLNGLRASGKTVNLVKLANTSFKLGHLVVVIALRKDLEAIYRRAGLLDDIKVITYKEYVTYMPEYAKYDIFVDEIEYFLKQEIFKVGNLASITSEEENTEHISRSDWDKDYKGDNK